jgi:phosphatidylserine decarboxylase
LPRNSGIHLLATLYLQVGLLTYLAKHRIKGKQFNIPNLLNVPEDSDIALTFREASIAIFRLAPGDYHRFHSPIDGEVGEIVNIAGQYYTGEPYRSELSLMALNSPCKVNPQAVNEPGFDVFTANTRSVLYMKHVRTSLPVVVVAIGALLVGSIEWTNGAQRGSTVRRGDELG